MAKEGFETSAGAGGETHQRVQKKSSHADGEGHLTTNQGIRVADNQNSLRSGARGPTLLEDFVLREKIFHFDHERIPERIVHARGSAARAKKRSRLPYLINPPQCMQRAAPCSPTAFAIETD